MKKIIGITGGIACGKSFVSSIIKEKYPVIDCDAITHEMWNTNREVTKLVASRFGEDILNNGIVVRKRLGSIVFSDSNKLASLNEMVHPIIIDTVLQKIADADSNIIFVDAPLLYETNLDKICTSVICVYAFPSIQLNRIMKRDKLTKLEAIKRIDSQMSIDEKKKRSQYIIDTNGTHNETKEKIKVILEEVANAI